MQCGRRLLKLTDGPGPGRAISPARVYGDRV